jgi:hypothetical protein
MAAFQARQQGNQGMSPWVAGGAGAVAGYGGAQAMHYIQSSHTMALAGLGLGAILFLADGVSTSNLSGDVTNWQSLATQIQGYAPATVSAQTPTTIQTDINNLRAFMIQICNQGAKSAYDAAPFAFGGTPVLQPAPVQSGAITSLSTSNAGNNNAVLVVVAVAFLLGLLLLLM